MHSFAAGIASPTSMTVAFTRPKQRFIVFTWRSVLEDTTLCSWSIHNTMLSRVRTNGQENICWTIELCDCYGEEENKGSCVASATSEETHFISSLYRVNMRGNLNRSRTRLCSGAENNDSVRLPKRCPDDTQNPQPTTTCYPTNSSLPIQNKTLSNEITFSVTASSEYHN